MHELDAPPHVGHRADLVLVVRPFVERDRQALAAIYRDCRAEAAWLPEAIRNRADFTPDTQGEAILVAVGDDGERVGFISAWEADRFIHHLYVRGSSRRMGVGAALLDALRARMPRPWRLKCVRANPAAIAFYLALEWNEIASGTSEDGPFALMERS